MQYYRLELPLNSAAKKSGSNQGDEEGRPQVWFTTDKLQTSLAKRSTSKWQEPTFQQPLQNLIENVTCVMPLSQVPLEGDSTLRWVMWKIGHWRLNSRCFQTASSLLMLPRRERWSPYFSVIFGQDSNVKIDLTGSNFTKFTRISKIKHWHSLITPLSYFLY